MGSSKKQTIGYKYFMGLHMGVCRGPIDELLEARVGDRRAWAGRERREKFFLSGGGFGLLFRVGVNVIPDNSIVVDGNETVYIDAPDLFGGDKQEGGIQGSMRVLMGGPTQVAPSGLSSMLGGLVPGFRGYVSLFFDGLIGAMNPYPKTWKFRVRRTNKGWDNDAVWYPEKAAIWLGTGQSHAGIRAMNPAHILYELWTNRDWGRGISASRLDLTSFQTAADQLYAEGFGLCLVWARQESISEYMQIILDHIGAACGPDLSTGKIRVKLIRDDYVAATLPIFGYDSGLLGIDDEQATAADAITNEIMVSWFDPVKKRQRQTAPVQNLGSIQAVGRHTSVREYPGLPTAALAARVAQRDLRASGRALKRYKIRLDRRGYLIQPGDVFRISDPDRGLESVVLRAGRVEEGSITDGTITITAVQDVFGLPSTVLVEEQPPEESPDDQAAPPVTVSRLIEQPYYEIVQTTDPANFDLLTSASGFVAGIAAMPASYSTDFLIYSRAGVADYTAKGDSGDWCPTALSTDSVAATAAPVIVALSSVVNLDFVAVGTPALWDNEILIVDDVDTTAQTVTLLRGCADTVSCPHTAGSRIWFYEGVLGKDSTEYLTGENVDVKLITVTPTTFLDPALAPELTLTLNQRFARPYAPGLFRVNASAYPTHITGNLAVSWAHRDRVLLADQLLDESAASVGPEPGTTYTVRVYDRAGDLVHTESGLTGTSWTYAKATEESESDDGQFNGRLRVTVEAARGGLTSWQAHDHTFDRAGYGLNYGLYYGAGV